MTDYVQMIEQLKRQNDLPDTTQAQREANNFRIQWLILLHQEKPSYTPTNATDVLYECLKNPDYRCTPAYLLNS